MSVLGSDSIKIQFTLDSVDYSKILDKINYSYENNYNKKLLKVRRDVRTGARKQVFKGNEKEFKYSILNVTLSEWEDFYIKLKTLSNIKYYPHFDNDYWYPVYCEKMEFTTYNDNSNIGIVEFEFKSSSYKDVGSPVWILETGYWNNKGVWSNNSLWKFGV